MLTTNSRVNNLPLVSVIIPTHNRALFIGDAVRSVLSQTYPHIEVIVVDDGSTDATDEIIKAINDARLQYIFQENRGRSSARNCGLRLAKGQYIAFLDSDDLYLPEKVDLQVTYLEAHPETAMVYTSARCIDRDGRLLDHKYEATTSGRIYDQIAFFTPVTITLPTVMVRREVFERVGGFDEKMHRFEDTDMWRRISKRYQIDALAEYTCQLRTHDDNALLAQKPGDIASALGYYARKILFEDNEISLATRKKGLAGLYNYYGMALMTVPRWRNTGRKLLRTSLILWPFGAMRGLVYLMRRAKLLGRSVWYRTLNRAYALYLPIKIRVRRTFASDKGGTE